MAKSGLRLPAPCCDLRDRRSSFSLGGRVGIGIAARGHWSRGGNDRCGNQRRSCLRRL